MPTKKKRNMEKPDDKIIYSRVDKLSQLQARGYRQPGPSHLNGQSMNVERPPPVPVKRLSNPMPNGTTSHPAQPTVMNTPIPTMNTINNNNTNTNTITNNSMAFIPIQIDRKPSSANSTTAAAQSNTFDPSLWTIRREYEEQEGCVNFSDDYVPEKQQQPKMQQNRRKEEYENDNDNDYELEEAANMMMMTNGKFIDDYLKPAKSNKERYTDNPRRNRDNNNNNGRERRGYENWDGGLGY